MSFKYVALTLIMAAVTSTALAPAAAASGGAERVLLNGRIYTMSEAHPWVDAVAISGGRYVAVGHNEEVKSLIGNRTVVTDLHGKMAMPGLSDGHVHPSQGGRKMLFECNFPFTASPKEIQHQVAQCVKQHSRQTWIVGGQWSSDLFKNHVISSPRKFLDTNSGGKAVMLIDDSGHNAWLNSKALELAGITGDTPDPKGGRYGRDKGGAPNGLAFEGARHAMKDVVPQLTVKQYVAADEKAVEVANSFGVTGMKDAFPDVAAIAAYQLLDRQGRLHAHIATNLPTPYGARNTPLDINRLKVLRKKYRSKHVNTNFVKIFLDGVPTSARTAAMLSPYVPPKGSHTLTRGNLHIPLEVLTTDMIALDKAGFTVKIHTAGDRSVHVALEAIARTRAANGNSGLRHELAHAGFIDPEDLPRFARLGVVADLSPYIWYPSPIIDSLIGAVGERGKFYFPIKTLLASGAPVLAGSDWPAAVASMNPWIGIEAMVTRRDPKGKTPGALWPTEAITLDQALRIFTIDNAKALLLGKETGTIAVGKLADLIVLDRNLFKIPADQISETQVLETFFEGKPVYRRIIDKSAASGD